MFVLSSHLNPIGDQKDVQYLLISGICLAYLVRAGAIAAHIIYIYICIYVIACSLLPAGAAPWDLDLTFGPQRGPESSLYVGLEGVGGPWWNRTKDSFLQVFRPEYEARLLELNNTVLHPDNVLGKLDEVVAEYDLDEIGASPSGPSCDFVGREGVFRNFVTARHAFVNAQLGP